MIPNAIRAIADAVLYEGYMLYPYRPSALKNRQRWTFGVVFPDCAATRRHGDISEINAECIVVPREETELAVVLRFLHIIACRRSDESWEEALECEVPIGPVALKQLLEDRIETPFSFAGLPLTEDSVTRVARPISGIVTISAVTADESLVKIGLNVTNLTVLTQSDGAERMIAQKSAFASAHAIVSLHNGEFVSLLDPPPVFRSASAACRNQGWWPVLAGADGARDTMLFSPIILYDYPKIAPESPGDLFDGGEIDEILSLRIMTLTDAEKGEIARSDPRVAALLARTEMLSPEQMSSLHGTFRPPASLARLRDGAGSIRVGTRVRLKPRPGGDIFDLALAGKTAVIEAIERDFEDRVHVAVTIDDDPGRDLGLSRFPGHRFFFSREEVDVIDGSSLP